MDTVPRRLIGDEPKEVSVLKLVDFFVIEDLFLRNRGKIQEIIMDISSRKKRAGQILKILKKMFPNAGCTLNHFTPFQLLIATILSAQCTDKRVNEVTPSLFSRFPTPHDFAAAPLTEIEDAIRSTGFYHNKAKNIKALCKILEDKYQGNVPGTMEELVTLPGVGRKTANVVLGNAFGIVSGFVVDTHVTRLSHRLGLSDQNTAEKIEDDLIQLFPRKEWVDMSHRLILLGRGNCSARKPKCDQCDLKGVCPKNI